MCVWSVLAFVFSCMGEKDDYRYILLLLLMSTARYTITQMSQSCAYLTRSTISCMLLP